MDSSNDPIVLIPADNPSFITNNPIAINAVMMQYQYLYGIENAKQTKYGFAHKLI